MFADIPAWLSVLVWIYLLGARGGFWLASVRDSETPRKPRTWPAVAVVIPARNEADVIGASVGSLLGQDYPGVLTLIVVDDDSSDGTAAVAQAAAERHTERKMRVVKSRDLPAGWTGKLWALKNGVAAAEQSAHHDYLLFTDADIVHASDTVARLVAQAMSGGFVLTSLMAKLRCENMPERMQVPAFIYFFQMLYPFPWVRQPQAATAAAAGGCMLVRADALRKAGGIDSIRNALIDDCALAQRLKAIGPIWLGLTERAVSVRPYESFSDIKRMVARSAYAQLGYSPILLAGTILGLTLTFLTAPLLTVFASGVAEFVGLAVWLAMAISFQPTLRFYRQSPLWGLALPAIAFLYAYYTLDSAYQHLLRRGGQWKGRVHINTPGLP